MKDIYIGSLIYEITSINYRIINNLASDYVQNRNQKSRSDLKQLTLNSAHSPVANEMKNQVYSFSEMECNRSMCRKFEA